MGSQRSQGHTWGSRGGVLSYPVLSPASGPGTHLHAHLPLTGGPCVAGFAETLGLAIPQDAAHGKTGGTELAVHTCCCTWASSCRHQRAGREAQALAYLLDGTAKGQGQLMQGAEGSSEPPRRKPASQSSQWLPAVLCWQPWADTHTHQPQWEEGVWGGPLPSSRATPILCPHRPLR